MSHQLTVFFESHSNTDTQPYYRISDKSYRLSVLLDQQGLKQGWTIEIDPPNNYLIVNYKNDKRFGHGYLVQNRFKVFNAEFDGTDLVRIKPIPTTQKEVTNERYRFEGAVYNGMPYGYGQLYSIKSYAQLYSGLVIEWKRFGFGSSYFSFGIVEYCGYWVDDMWHGSSVMHTTKEMYKREWCFGLSLGKYVVYKNNGAF